MLFRSHLSFALAVVATLSIGQNSEAQYNLHADSTDYVLIVASRGNSVRYTRYARRVVNADTIKHLRSGHYYSLREELQGTTDPKSDAEPALLLARLLRRQIRVKEAWYRPRGRDPIIDGRKLPGHAVALVIVRLESDDIERLDLIAHRLDDPLNWLSGEYAHYTQTAEGRVWN